MVKTHGKNVRVPMLVAGVAYVMRTWLKQPTYTVATFESFQRDGVAVEGKLPKLNAMAANETLHFSGDVVGHMEGNCLLNADGIRITFFEEHGDVVVPEPVVKAPRVVKAKPVQLTAEEKQAKKDAAKAVRDEAKAVVKAAKDEARATAKALKDAEKAEKQAAAAAEKARVAAEKAEAAATAAAEKVAAETAEQETVAA